MPSTRDKYSPTYTKPTIDMTPKAPRKVKTYGLVKNKRTDSHKYHDAMEIMKKVLEEVYEYEMMGEGDVPPIPLPRLRANILGLPYGNSAQVNRYTCYTCDRYDPLYYVFGNRKRFREMMFYFADIWRGEGWEIRSNTKWTCIWMGDHLPGPQRGPQKEKKRQKNIMRVMRAFLRDADTDIDGMSLGQLQNSIREGYWKYFVDIVAESGEKIYAIWHSYKTFSRMMHRFATVWSLECGYDLGEDDILRREKDGTYIRYDE